MIAGMLLLLIVVLAGSAPSIVVAIYCLWDGAPRMFRPWHVPRGTRERYAMPVFLFWLFSPIWLGLLWAFTATLAGAFGQVAWGALAVYWAIASLIIGWFAGWVYRARWAGASIGLATFTIPAVLLGVLELEPDVSSGWSMQLAAAALWNVWVIATIVRAEGPGLRTVSDQCQRCGYDLSAVTGARCPECGAPTADRTPEML